MKYINTLLLVLIPILFAACTPKELPPISFEKSDKEIEYMADVKPILDNRCVVCHSCYNAPCQSKFSSFSGIDRGSSKSLVYNATRLRAADPTRLFIDAKDTQEWREKGFFSLTDKTISKSTDSIMLQMLGQKNKKPEIIGNYEPENDKWQCPKNEDELYDFFEDKPNHGMPYGFPKIKQVEFNTLANWLNKGAYGPNAKEKEKYFAISKKTKNEIKKWEDFLNNTDAKHSVSARYMYEHLFLAHIRFKDASNDFFELVRSKTPSSKPIDIIATVRPFDDPKVEKFYYRFRKINSTIVHKTHMVVDFDDKVLKKYTDLFINSKWNGTPKKISYEKSLSSNPFIAFEQIPAQSRYEFLLDNAHYVVMTYIKGPVCRGQMALNVIHDHFWVMFKDPKHDATIQTQGFLIANKDNLSMPIESNEQRLLKTFSDKYRDKYEVYFNNKQKLYDSLYPQGQGLESIWKGKEKKDTPLLTIYRHFNSASVHKGVIGKLPRTAWVIDYPQLERIYYSLVAGYDVYGNVSHQTNIRRYMDFLRMEGELNFISYMPKETRLKMFKSWYLKDEDIQNIESYDAMKRDTKIEYKTKYFKNEFIEQVVNKHILKSTNINFDPLNYVKAGEKAPEMPKQFLNLHDIKLGFKSLTKEGRNFVRYVKDNGINNILLRIKMEDKKDVVMTMVINRWHDNVNSLFGEESRLDSSKDDIDFIIGSIGSYPNMFAQVDFKELPDFFDLIQNFENKPEYINKVKKYFVSRSAENFWETYDWFQDDFNKKQPIHSGLYDLNRYYKKPW